MEDVVIKTQEALPEPTQEEIEATAAYQKILKKQNVKSNSRLRDLERWIDNLLQVITVHIYMVLET